MEKTFIGYSRVSKENKNGKNLSLDEQETWLSNECVRHNASLVMMSEGEGVSGRKLSNRPVLNEALRKLDKGEAHGLIVKKLDRLARNTADFLYILERSRKGKWTLVIGDLDIDTSSPMGEAMATISAVFAQLERERIAERARTSHAHRKSVGIENPIFLPSIPDELSETILAAYRERGMSYNGIARQLNAQGVLPFRNGKKWYASTIKYTVERLSA